MKSVMNCRLARAVLLVVLTLGCHGSLGARGDKVLTPSVRDIIVDASRAAPQDPPSGTFVGRLFVVGRCRIANIKS
jgi:hypothetical protein